MLEQFRQVINPVGPVFSTLHNEKGESGCNGATLNQMSLQILGEIRKSGGNVVEQRYPEEHRSVLMSAALVVVLYDLAGESSDWFKVLPATHIGVPAWASRWATSSVVGIDSRLDQRLIVPTAEAIQRFFLREYLKSGLAGIHSGFIPLAVTKDRPRSARRRSGGLRLPFSLL